VCPEKIDMPVRVAGWLKVVGEPGAETTGAVGAADICAGVSTGTEKPLCEITSPCWALNLMSSNCSPARTCFGSGSQERAGAIIP
jgi:hypothetical protein